MAGKTSDWRPGPTVCRCCLTEGCYKDISTEYFWMGKREVYSEMLSETFNVSISYSQSGGPNSNSRLICEPCISRLRDASDFKRQVQDCEKTFMNHLDPSTSGSIQVEVEPLKLERVKTEKIVDSDDDNFDTRDNFDDDDDDMDDQPLTKLASKVPKKEAEDLLDLLDTSQITIKRKSTVKSKEPPKKLKKKETIIKPTTSKTKAVVKAPAPVEKKKKADEEPSRSNAATILLHTTALPFRVNDKSVLCVYCFGLYEDPNVFREHMRQEHENPTLKVVFYNLPKTEFIKADLTDLRCKICSQPFDDLETVARHLTDDHGKKIDFDNKLGVMPYRLKKDEFVCAVCAKVSPSLHHLNRHTISHFLSYVCHFCGSSYIATTGLLRHLRTKHQSYEAQCKSCGKKFPSIEAKDRHRRTEKTCMPYSCNKCMDRFPDWRLRKLHMESKHGQTKKTYRCADCNIEFASDMAYYNHFKLHHSGNCAMCKHCNMKFVSLYRLKRHLSKHNM